MQVCSYATAAKYTANIQFHQIDPPDGFYVQGDTVVTSIIITNTLHQNLSYYTRYYYVSSSGIVDERNAVNRWDSIGPQEPSRSIDFSRLVSKEGDWTVVVEVKEDGPQGYLAANFSRPVFVKPAEYRVLQQQANTETNGIITGGLTGIIGAVVGAGATYYFTSRGETKKLENEKNNIIALVKHDLDDNFDFLTTISNRANKQPPAYFVVANSPDFKQTEDMLSHKLFYQNIPFEIKARVFMPDQLKRLELAYSKIHSFRTDVIQRHNKSQQLIGLPTTPGFYFPKDEIDDVLKEVIHAREII